jgi:phage shock protein E
MKARTPGLIALLAIAAVLASCQGVPKTPVPRDDSRYEDAKALYELVSRETELYILVDVRTPEEYLGGHIPSALNIPYDAIGTRVPTPDKDALIILYCRSGARAQSAKQTLDAMGYTRVVNFGGVDKWTGQLDTTELPGLCPCRLKH